MDLYTQHLISTIKAELFAVAIMIETDNRCTKEEIKDSLLELISKELDGYELNLNILKAKKE